MSELKDDRGFWYPDFVAPTEHMDRTVTALEMRNARRREVYADRPLAPIALRIIAGFVDRVLSLVILIGIPYSVYRLVPKRQGSCLNPLNGKAFICSLPNGRGFDLLAASIVIAVLSVVFLYWVEPTARTGQTFGKWLVGIKVVDKWSGLPIAPTRSFARFAAANLSVLTFGIGFFMAWFSRHGQTWQDRLASSIVVVARGQPKAPAAPRTKTAALRTKTPKHGPTPATKPAPALRHRAKPAN